MSDIERRYTSVEVEVRASSDSHRIGGYAAKFNIYSRNLGGFVGPYFIGKIKDMTGSAAGGLIFLAALVFISFTMMALMRLGSGRDAVAEPGLAAGGKGA